jgi:hypothetical protein
MGFPNLAIAQRVCAGSALVLRVFRDASLLLDDRKQQLEAQWDESGELRLEPGASQTTSQFRH